MSEPPTRGDDFVGKQLYTPEVLLTYFALGGLPCGLFLYGLNVARRGQQWVGYLLSALALVTFTLLVLSPEGGSARRFVGSIFGLSFAKTSSESVDDGHSRQAKERPPR